MNFGIVFNKFSAKQLQCVCYINELFVSQISSKCGFDVTIIRVSAMRVLSLLLVVLIVFVLLTKIVVPVSVEYQIMMFD